MNDAFHLNLASEFGQAVFVRDDGYSNREIVHIMQAKGK